MADDEKSKNLDKVWISTDNLTISERKVVEYLAQNEQVTNRQIQELLGVKDSRALKVLKELVAKKIVVKRGKQRESYYILNKELDI